MKTIFAKSAGMLRVFTTLPKAAAKKLVRIPEAMVEAIEKFALEK
jgi:hypothetical protein